MPSYIVQSPCTVEDAPGLSKSNISAFWRNTWWRQMWPGRTLDDLIETVAARTPKNLLTDRHIRRHQKVVNVESGEIVGYARWILPASRAKDWLEAQAPDVAADEREVFDEQYAKADFNYRDDSLDHHVPEWKQKYKHSDCLILDYLGVHPDHQRRGIGSMLVKSGVRTADELGLDIFVIATGQNACDMYVKAGFVVLEEKRESLEPYGADEMYETFCLVRTS